MSRDDAQSPPAASPTIDELVIADEPERWESLGFSVSGESCELGCIRLRFAGCGAGSGIVGWSLRRISGVELDGLPTTRSTSPERDRASMHPNGVVSIDHVVAMTPALERSVSALQTAGLKLRRIREQPTPAGAPRQAFFRLGDEILEVVQEPADAVQRGDGPEGPARFWGLALTVEDLDRTVESLGESIGSIRPAVQRGRRIATLRRSAGLAVPIAVMSKEPPQKGESWPANGS